MDEQLAESGFPRMAGMEHSAANSPESLLMGGHITRIPKRVKAANPETYVTASAPPFFLQHGTQDAVVPVQGSIRLAAKLEKVLGKEKVKLELLEGAGHGDPLFETPKNIEKVLDFIDQHLRAYETI
jgi:dipeptidyl aminopeptidase/acylaminoacyl peptidase